jgi:hypothetical protein
LASLKEAVKKSVILTNIWNTAGTLSLHSPIKMLSCGNNVVMGLTRSGVLLQDTVALWVSFGSTNAT